MNKHEPVYNVFAFFENDMLTHVGIKQYHRQGSDKKKLSFLKERALVDFKSAQRVPLRDPMHRDAYFANQRVGNTTGLFESLFQMVGAGPAPLYCVTAIVNGAAIIDLSTPMGPLDMSKLPENLTGPGKMEDYLFKYADEENGTFDMPALINDDYFKAMHLLFNNGFYISCLKLLVSFIDTIAYVELGERGPREIPVFVDWVTTFSDGVMAGATGEELWEFRNGLLHMTNLESRKVAAGKVGKLLPYVTTGRVPPSIDGTKHLNIVLLMDDVAKAIQRWIITFNEDRSKMAKFVERYDRVVSDKRQGIIIVGSETNTARPA